MKRLVMGIVALLLCAGASSGAEGPGGPKSYQGEWSLNNWKPGDSLRLELTRRTSTSSWTWSCDLPFSDLSGLTREQLRAARSAVSFTIDRDAGAFVFDGTVMLGLGGGAFRFVPNPAFAPELRALGYGDLGEEDVFTMALRDVSLSFARVARRLSPQIVDAKDLVRLRDRGVDGDYLRALAESGYTGLTADDVVKLRERGVDAGFVKGLVAAGLGRASVEEIIRLREHGVDAEYVARVRASGFENLTVEQIVRLHDHGVD